MHSEDKVQSSGRINCDQEMDEFLSELDAIDATAPGEAPKPANAFADRPELLAKLVTTAGELKADAYANGWTAKAWQKIDEHRKENPEEHAQNQRTKYQKKVFDETGRVTRRNRKNPTPEQRAADLATNSKNYRKRMTPEQKEAEANRKKESRKKAKQADREATEKLSNFGRF